MLVHYRRLPGDRLKAPWWCSLPFAGAATALLMWLSVQPAGGAVQQTSAGCGKRAATGQFTLGTRDGAGRARTYLVRIPAGYDPDTRYPLVFVFHGSAGDGAQAAAWGLQNAAGAASSAVFVFPNGMPYQNLGVGWDDSANGYDLPFFDRMLSDLEAGYCIDTTRIFAAGFSWGADFTIALACARGEKLRAAAVNSATDEFKDDTNFRTYQNWPCSSRVHPRIRFEHAMLGDKAYPPPDFATTSKLLQNMNSCSVSSTTFNTRASATTGTSAEACVLYQGCASPYLECTFDHGIGHTLPPTWAADTWAFFSAPP